MRIPLLCNTLFVIVSLPAMEKTNYPLPKIACKNHIWLRQLSRVQADALHQDRKKLFNFLSIEQIYKNFKNSDLYPIFHNAIAIIDSIAIPQPNSRSNIVPFSSPEFKKHLHNRCDAETFSLIKLYNSYALLEQKFICFSDKKYKRSCLTALLIASKDIYMQIHAQAAAQLALELYEGTITDKTNNLHQIQNIETISVIYPKILTHVIKKEKEFITAMHRTV